MTVQETFNEKVKADMLYYENILIQAKERKSFKTIPNIQKVLSTLYPIIMQETKKNANKNKGKSIAVVGFNAETNTTLEFDTMQEGAKHMGVHAATLKRYMDNDEPLNGFYFDFKL